MKNKYIILATLALVFASCDDYLNVTTDEVAKEDELFVKKSGFSDALTGAYMQMANEKAYGEYLTMLVPDAIANLWSSSQSGTSSATLIRDDMAKHEYENDYAKKAIDAVFSQLYSVILQDNIILDKLEKTDVTMTSQFKNIVKGEALAMRAFCHFDILRLFGQMPDGSGKAIQLPYSETISIHDIPKYYSFNDFVSKLNTDIDAALACLKDNDPIFDYTWGQLNSISSVKLEDDYFYYRRARFNYWAVKGLQTRMNLYLGNTSQAYSIAKEIIDAKTKDGEALNVLSGIADYNSYNRALPNECLLYMSKYNVRDISNTLFGTSASQIIRAQHLCCESIDRLNELFAGQNTSSNNRYLNVWNKSIQDNQAFVRPTIKKYYWTDDEAASTSTMTQKQIVPLIRMSEIYLIAIETTSDLAEANSLWDTYQRSHNVLLEGDAFASLDDVKAMITDEYIREFYGEGQTLYTYKRLGLPNLKWSTETADEFVYCLPLPDSEYNPN